MKNQFINSISIDWDRIQEDSYFMEIPALKSLRTLDVANSITFFVGENGTGKSTLLEAVAAACGFNPEGGSKNFNFATKDTHSTLYQYLKLDKGWRRQKDGYFLRAESFYNVASQVEEYAKYNGKRDFYDNYGGKSLHSQSHGESFLALMQNRFTGDGLYLLDEPEAALSPQRQLTLLLTLDQLRKKGSQFLIATHSPILLGIPGADIYSFDQGEIRRISYEETDCYQVMEMFINNREYLLERLLLE